MNNQSISTRRGSLYFVEEVSPIQYIVICGKSSGNGTAVLLEFSEQAPASLLNRTCPPDMTKTVLERFVDSHTDEIIRSRSWLCGVCGKSAVGICHVPVPLLYPREGDSIQRFAPSVNDYASPICGVGCAKQAGDWADEFIKTNMSWIVGNSGACDLCGKSSHYPEGHKQCENCNVTEFGFPNLRIWLSAIC